MDFCLPDSVGTLPFPRHDVMALRFIPLFNKYVSTFFARTSVFKKLKGFCNLPFAEDLDFIRRAHKKGLKIEKMKEPTYRYYVDADNRLCDLYERGGDKAILEFRGHRAGLHYELFGDA